MWNLPGPGLEPMSPALAGGFLTTAPPGKPYAYFLQLSTSLTPSVNVFSAIPPIFSILFFYSSFKKSFVCHPQNWSHKLLMSLNLQLKKQWVTCSFNISCIHGRVCMWSFLHLFSQETAPKKTLQLGLWKSFSFPVISTTCQREQLYDLVHILMLECINIARI